MKTTIIPSSKVSGITAGSQLSRSRSSDVEQTLVSVRGQHKKKELLSEPDLEASSEQVSRRVQPARKAKAFESVEIPEERKRRSYPMQRQPLLIETGTETHLDLSKVEST